MKRELNQLKVERLAWAEEMLTAIVIEVVHSVLADWP
jgi:hypothetical protein